MSTHIYDLEMGGIVGRDHFPTHSVNRDHFPTHSVNRDHFLHINVGTIGTYSLMYGFAGRLKEAMRMQITDSWYDECPEVPTKSRGKGKKLPKWKQVRKGPSPKPNIKLLRRNKQC